MAPQKYSIEFDWLDGHNPGTSGGMTPYNLQPRPWQSIAHPEGALITNSTLVTIRAIRIDNRDPEVSQFSIDAASAGRLFRQVWVRSDSSAGLFLDAALQGADGIPDGESFWMRVLPSTNGQFIFRGQCFEQNPEGPFPSPEWQRIL